MTATLYTYDLNEDCYRVRLAASCIGVKLLLIGVDEYPGREHLSASYLTLNPGGRLPILTDGALTLTQTGAILWHLATAYDPDQRFIPQDAGARSAMMDWLFFLSHDLQCAHMARADAMRGNPVPGPRHAARQALRQMDDHITRAGLIGQGYFAGAGISLVDLALFPSFALSRDYGVDHDEFPGLRLWARRVRGVTGFMTMPGIPDYH